MRTSEPSVEQLAEWVKRDRLKSYARLRGGYCVPLAGFVYWAALGLLGYTVELSQWAFFAFVGSGAIFPLALLFSKAFQNPFMKDKTSVSSVLLPAFIGMLLFWPMIIAAAKTAPDLVPLILAIGMSIHWPVIGWGYGRTSIYSAHAIVRALGVLYLWFSFPDLRLTWLPFFVAGVYAATVLVILVDSGRIRKISAQADA